MRRLLAFGFVLAALPAFAQAPTVTVSGDGAATVVSVGTQGPAGGSVSTTATIEYVTSDGVVAAVFPLKALTESTATPVVLVGVAAGASCSGVFEYTVSAADAIPDRQSRHGAFNFTIVNKAGTESCTIGAATESADDSVFASSNGGTLTYGITCDTTPTNGAYFSFNAVSSLVQTSLNIKPRINLDPSAAGVCTAVAQ